MNGGNARICIYIIALAHGSASATVARYHAARGGSAKSHNVASAVGCPMPSALHCIISCDNDFQI